MNGKYIIGYIKTKEPRFLISAISIKNAVTNVCKAIGLRIVGNKFHIFKNTSGITYCFILSQSHFVVHTWPEENKIFFDIFTCNKIIDESKLANIISKQFRGEVKELRKVEQI